MSNLSTPWTFRPSLMVVDAAQTDSERKSGYGAYQVCRIGGETTDFSTDDLEQFGRLIETAPELLKCLKECMQYFLANDDGDVWYRAKMAIAKAEGRR